MKISNVVKRFGPITALDGVSAELRAGQVVALVGANGSGKTTLLSILAGMLAADEGEVRYDGEVFRRRRVDLRRRLMFLPEWPVFLANTTPLEHVGTFARAYEVDRSGLGEEVAEYFEQLGILAQAEASISKLSRGQAYKVGLVALFAVRPELWLVDEPFASGMDPRGIREFQRQVAFHAERGGTVLFSTQIVELASRLADTVLVLDEGRMVAHGSLDSVLEQSRHDERLRDVVDALRGAGA